MTTINDPAKAARAELDAQYNLRAAVPEHPEFFARYRERSEALRARRPVLLDQAYGAGARTHIDLFPGAHAGAPLYVFVHGGYWQAMDRKDFAFMAEPFLESGAAAALVGYDLAPEVEVATIVDQVRTALAWLYLRASSYGTDPERIVIAGHSAGGHLGAMLLATDWPARGLPADLIKAACLISGVFDLEPIAGCYLNDVLGLGPQDVRRLSPIYRPPEARVPVLLTLGALETEAFHEQTRAYGKCLRALGHEVEIMAQAGLHHFSIVEAMAEAGNPATRWTLGKLGLAGA